jgi:hypothetical protein
MHFIPTLPPAFLYVSPTIQILALFFAGWAFVMFLVLHIDGTRAK